MTPFTESNGQAASYTDYQQQSSHIVMDGSVYPPTTLPTTIYQDHTHSPVMNFWPEMYDTAIGDNMRAQSAPIGGHNLYRYEQESDELDPTTRFHGPMEVLQTPVHQIHTPSPTAPHSFTSVDEHMPAQSLQKQSKYAVQKCNIGRFESTLCSQTAMFHEEEVPSTYLNKGQTYMLKIVDKTPFVSGSLPVKYVTSIRISFEYDELRGKAAECWRLWKRTRGRTNNSECSKSHKKQWQAVELVETATDSLYAPPASQNMANGHGSFGLPACAQLVNAQFDGLTVVWSPNQNVAAHMPQECLIPIRFNFLSTDFMPSKGVKGAPMRLCVKTKVRQSGASSQVLAASSNGHKDFTSPAISVASPAASTPTSATEQGSIGSMVNPLDETTNEAWYCKLLAFRDHGAERKFQNHRQQIENAIANNSAKLANLLSSVKGDSHSPRGNLGSSPSSDPGAVRGNAGVTKMNRRRKCTGSTDLIYRVQTKIDALRFALESAEDCIMLTMTSWHPDDDPDAVRPDILNDDQSDVGPTQTGIRSEASATQPSTGGPLLPNTLLGLHHIAPSVSPLPVRPHSADDRMHGHPMFTSSPNFATTATTVSPYSETQELALSYGIATAHTSPLYPPEDFMQLPLRNMGEQYQHQGPLLQYGGFQNQMHGFDDLPMSSLDLFDGFTVYDPLEQNWNDLSDPVPINPTGQVF